MVAFHLHINPLCSGTSLKGHPSTKDVHVIKDTDLSCYSYFYTPDERTPHYKDCPIDVW